MNFLSKKEKGHFQLEEESDSTLFLQDQFRFHQKLKNFHSLNYHTSLASYYADALVGWAIVFFTLIFFILALFLGPFEHYPSTQMFVVTCIMFVIKVSVETVINSEENFPQTSLKFYAQQSKAIQIAFFLTAWLAPLAEHPFITYFIFIPIGFTLYQMINASNVSYPQQKKGSRILWSIFLVLIIAKKLFTPDSFQGSFLLVLEFLFLPEILGFLCEFSRFIGQGKPSSQFQTATYLYSQMGHSQRLRLCFLPLYPSMPALAFLIIMIQSSIYLMIRSKKKHELMLMKFIRNSNRTLIKLTSNLTMIVDSDAIKGGSQEKMKLLKKSIDQDFSDEMCCMCNNNIAQYVNGTCFHACLCKNCRRKQKTKMARWTIFKGCPICNTQGDKHAQINTDSYKSLMRGVVGKSWQGYHNNSTYSFRYMS